MKWYNPTKGNGFIRPNGSDRGVFVHITAVEKAGLDTLNEGQAVEYQVVTTRGRAGHGTTQGNCNERQR